MRVRKIGRKLDRLLNETMPLLGHMIGVRSGLVAAAVMTQRQSLADVRFGIKGVESDRLVKGRDLRKVRILAGHLDAFALEIGIKGLRIVRPPYLDRR